MKRIIILTILSILLSIGCTNSALAYIDPGTGTYILQLVVAGLLGAAVAAKIFWTRIKAFFVKVFSKKGNTEEN